MDLGCVTCSVCQRRSEPPKSAGSVARNILSYNTLGSSRMLLLRRVLFPTLISTCAYATQSKQTNSSKKPPTTGYFCADRTENWRMIAALTIEWKKPVDHKRQYPCSEASAAFDHTFLDSGQKFNNFKWAKDVYSRATHKNSGIFRVNVLNRISHMNEGNHQISEEWKFE